MKTSLKLIFAFFLLIILCISIVMGIINYKSATRISGNGIMTTEERKLSNFNKVSGKGGLQVNLIVSNDCNVVLKGDQALISQVKTEVVDGVLEISSESDEDRIEVDVSLPLLAALHFSQGASVKITSLFTGDKLDIEMSSGAFGNLNINYKNISCKSSSGSILELAGSSGNASFTASSGSTVDGLNLEAQEARVIGSSGSVLKLKVQKKLSADVSSGSNLRYSGHPVIDVVNQSSGAQIEQVQ